MAEIADTKRLLEIVADHPIMSQGLLARLNKLELDLVNIPAESSEPVIDLLFSGNAVFGSQGIKSNFVSKTMTPVQEMIKTQTSLARFGKVGKRGLAKKGANAELYLTALPRGSFGYELSQLQSEELFDSLDVSKAMKEVISLVADAAKDDTSFEAAVENTPKRNLENLKKFLQEIVAEKSILKMESNEINLALSREEVAEAYYRVSSTIDDQESVIINGVFRGVLLNSGKFEILDQSGRLISGFISQDLSEETLIEYDQAFLNKLCTIFLKQHRTKFKTGNEKIDYELLEIRSTDQAG